MKQKELIKIFKAIANERRFLILKHIYNNKELSVGKISELINLSFKSSSRHLSVLIGADLVKVRQLNVNRFYSINESGFPSQIFQLLFK
jgi:DNA-binding transcriptional ArsR family regulator